MRIPLVLGVCFALCSVLPPEMASAATYVVRADGTGDFATIQDAIDAAIDGDVIELANGLFTGNRNRDLSYRGKAITIRSQGGAENCIIDPQGSPLDEHNGFQFGSGEGPNSTLEGVTIQHGNFAGGGINVSSSPVIRDCVITENASGGYHSDGAGAGIQCGGGSPSFISCTISSNRCLGAGSGYPMGGGVYVYNDGSPTFERCEISGNVATSYRGHGGGICCGTGTSVSLVDCTIQENGSIWGCGVAAEGARVSFMRCVFSDNAGSSNSVGGGAYCSNATGTFSYCVFVQNNVTNGGGGLWCEDSAIDVVNCTFYGNSGGGLGSGGGGVHAEGSAVVTIGNTIMVSNDSYPFGPVSCGGTSTATLTCCDLYGNEGGDWVDCTAGQAGINGNISRDPLFCDAPSRDFRIDLNSPCRPHPPENPDCDLIGAAPVGCGSTPTKLTTWGRLKSSYR